MLEWAFSGQKWFYADMMLPCSFFFISTKRERKKHALTRSGVHLLVLNTGSPPGLDFRASWSALPYFIGNLVHISWAGSLLTSDSSHGARGYIQEALSHWVEDASCKDDTVFGLSLPWPVIWSVILFQRSRRLLSLQWTVRTCFTFFHRKVWRESIWLLLNVDKYKMIITQPVLLNFC